MTYCVALNLEQGLLFASDSRTNAGVDDVRRAGKMRTFGEDGQRLVVTLSAGNLSVTQNALNLLGVPTFYQYVVRGGILLAAVIFDRLRQTGGLSLPTLLTRFTQKDRLAS